MLNDFKKLTRLAQETEVRAMVVLVLSERAKRKH